MGVLSLGRVATAVFFSFSLVACSAGGTATVPKASKTGAQNSRRHVRVIGVASQPSDSSPCGTCSCSADPSGADGMVTTPDQGAPCMDNGSDVPIPSGGADPGPPPPDANISDPQPTPTPEPYDVAVYTSAPTDGQKCGNNPGSSYGYHDNLNYVRNGVPAQVQNINEVVQAAGFPFSAGSQPMLLDTLIGWMYQDQWGYYYFQANPNLTWSPSVSVSWTAPGGFGVAFGLNAAPNTAPQQLQSNGSPATGKPKLSAGKNFLQCWSSLKVMSS